MNIVEIKWQSSATKQMWTEPCAQIMEQFGLPGNRYTTEITNETMKFHFKTEHDALMCQLLISEYR